MKRLAMIVLTYALGGCGPRVIPPTSYATIVQRPQRASSPSPEVTQTEWSLSRDRLAHIRAEQPERPYVERVRLAIIDPRSGFIAAISAPVSDIVIIAATNPMPLLRCTLPPLDAASAA
jgi:hypothetical protein